MSAAPTVIDNKAYRNLLAKALPHVIHTEEENEQYIAWLEELHDRGNLSPEEEQMSELLTLLIEDFESKHYRLKSASPVSIVKELMEANDLKQADLIDVFGTASTASEVLSSKRGLSKTHIQKLTRRFRVPSDLFLLPPDVKRSHPRKSTLKGSARKSGQWKNRHSKHRLHR
jgi:HTH-type transcriptional regulator/antitoxin HigA